MKERLIVLTVAWTQDGVIVEYQDPSMVQGDLALRTAIEIPASERFGDQVAELRDMAGFLVLEALDVLLAEKNEEES